ncbi:hypothetical protein MLPF_1874 [Mycobacterium lepromatosis]|nr:hypothetical protein MLPF_1874 [Mycobacterium lepromatosis]
MLYQDTNPLIVMVGSVVYVVASANCELWAATNKISNEH